MERVDLPDVVRRLRLRAAVPHQHGLWGNHCPRARSARVRHPFLGNCSAPFRYTGVLALQRYINKAWLYTFTFSSWSLTSFSTDPLLIDCVKHCSWRLTSQTSRWWWIMATSSRTTSSSTLRRGNWDISVLPCSFISFTLHTTKDDFIANIARSLCWEEFEKLLMIIGSCADILENVEF